MQGYKIPFIKKPQQKIPPNHQKWSQTEKHAISKALARLIQIGAVSEAKPVKDQFISHIFLTPKPDGTSRLIINLKKLNNFVQTVHFKLEDHKTVARLVSHNCFMAKIDLKDAYFLVPICPQHKKYLRFYFNDHLYEYNCLCFGISCAPLVFTKIIKPVIAYLREKGFMSVVYLDDFLLMGRNYDECVLNISETINILKYLGFIINFEKSVLTPSKICIYLGFKYNSLDMSISLPDKKRIKLTNVLTKFKNKKHCKIREFSKIIGVLISTCRAVKYGFLYTKLLEREKYLALQNSNGNYNSVMKISQNIIPDINWWIEHLKIATNQIRFDNYDLEIFTDASLTGWGVFCNGLSSRGFWSVNERNHHINYLELLAVFFGLKCFANTVSNCSILCRVDNSTAMAYVNRMGSIKYPKLNSITRTIWQWCEKRNIFIHASYIKSKDNVEADTASRFLQIDTEWSINKLSFNQIVKSFGSPTIDLFASRINKKCIKYVSWLRDPDAFAVDAFTLFWGNFYFYAFPPFSIILRTVQKIINDKAEGIMVVPVWPAQPWYPIFTALLSRQPLIFKPSLNLLSFGRIPHPLSEKLSLMAGQLSGKRFNGEKCPMAVLKSA